MAEVANCYRVLAELDEATTRTTATFNSLITPAPVRLDDDVWTGLYQQHKALKASQSTTLELFRRSLVADADPQLARLFLGELPDHLGESHHRKVLEHGAGTPVFFRTDEVAPGKIAEVQCPGSLWGTHEHLRDYYVSRGHHVDPISRGFVDSLRRHVGRAPVIHHLLDNASHPAGERY